MMIKAIAIGKIP